MADRTITVPVDPINRGIDRLDTNVRSGKIAEGLNVINDDGDLRRRDAFKTVYAAAPHFFPFGNCVSFLSDGLDIGETTNDMHKGVGEVTTDVKRIYVGSPEKFDGIDLGTVVYNSTPTLGIELAGFYFQVNPDDSFEWTQMPFLLDTSRLGASNAGDTKYLYVPFGKSGRVSWHKGDFSLWGTGSGPIGMGGGLLNGLHAFETTGLFWICLELRVSPRGTVKTNLPGTSEIRAPGVRVFHLSKINGIFPVRTKKKDVLVLCSDREERRGSEQGAMLGLVESPADKTKALHVIQEEGSGTYDQVAISEWQESVAPLSFPLSPAGIPGSDGTYGDAVATVQRKQVVDEVDWYFSSTSGDSEWRGGQALFLPSSAVFDFGAGSTALAIKVQLENVRENQYEHHLLRIVTSPPGGLGDGEENIIFSNTASDALNQVIFRVAEAGWTAFVPDADAGIKIYRPHCRAEVRPGLADYEVLTNDANTITLLHPSPPPPPTVPQTAWAPEAEDGGPDALPNDITNAGVNYYIGRDPRWLIPAGTFWTATYDNNSNSLYLANDHSEVLRFDGKHLRTLYPETDVEKDWHAERYANWTFLSEESRAAAISAGVSETSFLENSPILAHILVSFLRRMFALKTAAGDSVLRFTGENAYHVWPSHFIRAIPDDQNRELQGAAGLNNRLLVWSANAIMEFVFMGTEDQFDSRILYTGGGFISHHGVQVIKSTLVGPNTDGIYAFNGANLEPVLDDWTRVIEGGINVERLNRSSSVHLQQKSWYLLAVASSGSEYNDRIIVWDYSRNRFWLWSAPHGASFLAKDYDENGAERLLVGTNDGHVQVLCGREDDDGVPVTSYARTVPLNLFGEKEAAYTGVQSVVQNTAFPMDLKFFVDKRGIESKSVSMSADAGLNTIGALELGNVVTGTIGDTRYKTINNNLNAKGHDFQVEIGGSSPWRLRRMNITARDLGKR